ncbi:SxtJ family membrane protein [Leptospira sp. GIMC2001]|uniref:SxtJ family membrane protein n=1 Tax=Leptospira sp. GIMC2001 TaxID=1513297 RepID=UPI00234A18E0|nr:SxtJ family membrane protein [Leptospira sp. GIMC2001]WCL49592.1 SxtJ family membrane protein [Leptospira sp. GIMC2001]
MKENTIEHTKKDYRSFGFIVGGVLLIVFGLLIPYWKNGNWNPIVSYVGLGLIAIAALLPIVLKYPYIVWMKIGEVLGYINTRLILGIVFFILFAPIGLFRRLIGKDALNIKLSDKEKSYRKISNHQEIKHMERPF